MLLRILLRAPEWATTVRRAVMKPLLALPTVLQSHPNLDAQACAAAAAALGVLGGHPECLRVGGRARVRGGGNSSGGGTGVEGGNGGGQAEAWVVEYQQGAPDARVVYDASLDAAPELVSVELLTPIHEVGHTLTHTHTQRTLPCTPS